MHTWIWMLPLVSAASGLIISLVIGKMILARLPALLKKFAVNAASALFSLNDFRSKISDKNNIQNIMPFIEGHIDEFLRHKLGKAMPMIGMFIGDKTIVQMKSLFLTELEELFPAVMHEYMNGITSQLNIEEIISRKVASIPQETWKTLIRASLKKELSMIPIAGALAGFIIGLIQVALLLAIS